MPNNKRTTYFIVILLLITAYFPFFHHLDSLPLAQWDESKRAVSSLEMLENGNFLVTHFDEKPDMVGTKPPLLNWIQAFFMSILGPNELAVRLPSALAGLATFIVILVFAIKVLRTSFTGIIAGLILITLPGYVDHHVCRTGDFDALLTLFTTVYVLSFFSYLHFKQDRLLLLTGIFITLAAFTKGIAGLFFLPPLLFWALLQKQFLKILKSRQTYLSILLFLIVIAGFYGLRELYNPGYLEAVWENELGGRYIKAIDTHRQPISFYVQNLWDFQLGFWKYMLLIGFIPFFSKSKIHRNLSIYLMLNISFLLTLLSFAGTKLNWYIAPTLPLLAVWLGLGFYALFERLHAIFNFSDQVFLPIIYCMLLFGFPYYKIVQKVSNPIDYEAHKNAYARYLRAHPVKDNFSISTIGFNARSQFYRKVHNRNGHNIGTFYPKQRKDLHENYLLCTERAKKLFRVKHQLKVLEYWDVCELVQVIGFRPKPYQWPEEETPYYN